MWRYYEACRFYQEHKADLASVLTGPLYGRVWRLLEEQEPHMESSKSDYLRRGINFSLFDFRRRHRSGFEKVMFHLFKLSGSAIAEMRQPLVKEAGAPKRVGPEVVSQAAGLLEPGDVLYLPPGVPHHGVALGEECTTWSIGFRAPP